MTLFPIGTLAAGCWMWFDSATRLKRGKSTSITVGTEFECSRSLVTSNLAECVLEGRCNLNLWSGVGYDDYNDFDGYLAYCLYLISTAVHLR